MDSTHVHAQEISAKVIEALSIQPEVTWTHILLAIIGLFLWAGYEMRKVIIKRRHEFNIIYYVKDPQNLISYSLSILSLAAMFLLWEEVKTAVGFDMTNKIGCFVAGLTAHSFAVRVGNIAKKKKD